MTRIIPSCTSSPPYRYCAHQSTLDQCHSYDECDDDDDDDDGDNADDDKDDDNGGCNNYQNGIYDFRDMMIISEW